MPPRPRGPARPLVLAAVVGVGCGDGDVAQRWGQVCGDEGPLQLLDGLEVARPAWATADRIVVGLPTPSPNPRPARPATGFGPPPPIMSVEACGGDVDALDFEEAAALLGWRRCGESFAWDRVHAQPTDTGIATLTWDGLRWCPDDGRPAVEVTADFNGYHVSGTGRYGSNKPYTTDGDALLFIDPDHRLTRVDMPSTTTTIVAEDVAFFHVLPTHGFLVQPYEVVNGNYVATGIHRLQAETGSLTEIETGSLLDFEVAWPWGLQTEPSDPAASRIVDLRTDETHPLPAGRYELRRALPDDRALLVRRDESSVMRTHLLWSRGRESVEELVTAPHCSSSRATDDALQIVPRTDCEGFVDGLFENGELWRYPFDGQPPRHVADDVGWSWVLSEDRLVWSSAGPDGSRYGDLRVLDLSDGVQWLIARHAWMIGDRFDGPPAEAPWAPPDLDGDVLYFVDDGDTFSLWRAGLPP